MRHLWSAVLHQGTPWTATAPAARVIAGLVLDGEVDEPLQGRLVGFLAGVVEAPLQAALDRDELEAMAVCDLEPFLDAEDDEALYEDDDAANALYALSLLGCRDVAQVLLPVFVAALQATQPTTRAAASEGATHVARLPEHAASRDEVIAHLTRALEKATTDDERAAHLIALGALGTVPAAVLDHPAPAVRIAAALAPCWAEHPRAVEVLQRALEDAESSDRWFAEQPPQMQLRPRFSVVRALLDRGVPFDDLLEGALAISRCTSRLCVDFDWGPLLAAAFAPSPGRVETPAQRRYLRALVDRADLWQPGFGNADKWFRRAELPYDRDACAALLDAPTGICSSTGGDDAPS